MLVSELWTRSVASSPVGGKYGARPLGRIHLKMQRNSPDRFVRDVGVVGLPPILAVERLWWLARPVVAVTRDNVGHGALQRIPFGRKPRR